MSIDTLVMSADTAGSQTSGGAKAPRDRVLGASPVRGLRGNRLHLPGVRPSRRRKQARERFADGQQRELVGQYRGGDRQVRGEVRELSQAADSSAVGAVHSGPQPEEIDNGEIPLFENITVEHTLRVFLLSALARVFEEGGNALQGSFSTGGNVFYYSFQVTGMKLAGDPAALQKPQ